MQTEGIEPPHSGLQPDTLPAELRLRRADNRIRTGTNSLEGCCAAVEHHIRESRMRESNSPAAPYERATVPDHPANWRTWIRTKIVGVQSPAGCRYPILHRSRIRDSNSSSNPYKGPPLPEHPAKADNETRTRNLSRTRGVRFQLRHASEVPPAGIEPATLGLKVRCAA